MKISLEAPTGATHRQLCRPCRGLLQLNAHYRGFTAPAGVVSALSGLSLQSPRDCITMLKGRPHFGTVRRKSQLRCEAGSCFVARSVALNCFSCELCGKPH